LRLHSLAPARALAPWVCGYWFVEDWAGVHAGKPILTAPIPSAVLTVNFGRPNRMVGGPVVPQVSWLGIQRTVRQWRSSEDTAFVMVMLSVEGMVRLFPHLGGVSVDAFEDLGSLLGDSAVRPLRELAANREPMLEYSRLARALDRWLLSRIGTVAEASERGAMAAACRVLASGASVTEAAATAQVSRRQLLRWCDDHVGVGPKALSSLYRLEKSVRAVHSGVQNAGVGFADQAHEIRSWRRHLASTPGKHRRSPPSALAQAFGDTADGPAFYL